MVFKASTELPKIANKCVKVNQTASLVRFWTQAVHEDVVFFFPESVVRWACASFVLVTEINVLVGQARWVKVEHSLRWRASRSHGQKALVYCIYKKKPSTHEVCFFELRALFQRRKATCNGKDETLRELPLQRNWVWVKRSEGHIHTGGEKSPPPNQPQDRALPPMSWSLVGDYFFSFQVRAVPPMAWKGIFFFTNQVPPKRASIVELHRPNHQLSYQTAATCRACLQIKKNTSLFEVTMISEKSFFLKDCVNFLWSLNLMCFIAFICPNRRLTRPSVNRDSCLFSIGVAAGCQTLKDLPILPPPNRNKLAFSHVSLIFLCEQCQITGNALSIVFTSLDGSTSWGAACSHTVW